MEKKLGYFLAAFFATLVAGMGSQGEYPGDWKFAIILAGSIAAGLIAYRAFLSKPPPEA